MPITATVSFKLVGSCNLVVCSDIFNVWVMFDLIYPKAQLAPLAGSFTSFRPGDVANFSSGKVVTNSGFSSPGFSGIFVRWPIKAGGVVLKDTAGASTTFNLVFPPFGLTPLIELAGPDTKWPSSWKPHLGDGVYGPYACSYLNSLTTEMSNKLNQVPLTGSLHFRSAPLHFSWSGGGFPASPLAAAAVVFRILARRTLQLLPALNQSHEMSSTSGSIWSTDSMSGHLV